METVNCALCGISITNEEAPVLTMGAYGIPRYLCDDCAADIDIAQGSDNVEDITSALNRLGEKLSKNDPDQATIETMTDILNSSAQRCKAIKDGTYDFEQENEESEEILEDIPEDMKETEEDKALDEVEEEKNKKLEKILNWVSAIVFTAVGAFAVYRILDMFLF